MGFDRSKNDDRTERGRTAALNSPKFRTQTQLKNGGLDDYRLTGTNGFILILYLLL